jgi:cellulose synthase/poly-beta-1,6-N-acetylglucosamine synthase-like glycosyltransferase
MSGFLMVLNLFALLVSGLLCIPVGVFVLQVLTASFARRRSTRVPSPPTERGLPRFAVIMPAHNESQGIALAIQTVLSQCQPGDRLIVVADNCSDNTAEVALAAGAEVIERFDDQLRGKGYALDYGVRHLATSGPPDVVVVVDADCLVAPGALATLVRTSIEQKRPAQALYLMLSPPDVGLKTHVAEFAWVVKNYVRPLGYASLGWPCQLMGTGMAFPWDLIRSAPLATGHIVEDMQLGLDLAAAGSPPIFCVNALVTSHFPSQAEGTESQRKRWEHGHLSVIAAQGPRLIWQALARRQGVLLAMVLDLCVPPLASLVLMLLAWFALMGLWAGLTGLGAAVTVTGFALLGVVLGVLISWCCFARHVITARELLSVPAYVLSKVPLYVRLLAHKGQVEWVRTKRDAGPTQPPSHPPGRM